MGKIFQNKILCFLLFLISFVFCAYFNFSKIEVPYFGAIYKKIKVDVIFKGKQPEVFFDNRKIENKLKIDENHFQYFEKENFLINKININDAQKIEKIVLFNGNDVQIIKNLQQEIVVNNDKKLLDKICIIILSFIYNFYFYLIPYLFLFLFLHNFKGRINHKFVFIAILILGLILRISQINNIPFWDDEIYILAATSNYSKLSALINDPGNPPLYFILFKIYRLIVQNSDCFRFLSVIIGLAFNIVFYNYSKFLFGSKKGLVAFLIVSINIILIYFSQEIRCYMLLMLLAVINSFLLFKFKKKNTVKYTLATILILYTHFYASFFVLWNFLFGLVIFRKNIEKIKWFVASNIISFLSFLPFIIYKKESLTSSFNSWISEPQLKQIHLAIDIFFYSKAIFVLLFVALCVFVFLKSKKRIIKFVISYNFLAIIFIFISAILFSYLIKPIFSYRYFYIVFPSYLILVLTIIFHKYNFKLKTLFAFALFICLTVFSRVNYQNLFCNHNLYLKFINLDIDKYKNNYVFMSDTVQNYKEYTLNEAKMIYLPINEGIDFVNVEKYISEKTFVAYVLNLYLDNKTFINADTIELYKTPLGVFTKIEFK